MAQEKKLYEIIDQTSPEQYFILGLFESYGEAKNELLSADSDSFSSISEHADEGHEIINIRERGIGWKPEGKVVFRMARERDDNLEEWSAVEITEEV